MTRGLHCEHRGCTSMSTDLRPQFTMALNRVAKENLKTHPQPQFYCRKHRSKHPDVSPIDGKPRERR